MLSDSAILRHIARQPKKSAGYKQLLRELGVKASGRRELTDRLEAFHHALGRHPFSEKVDQRIQRHARAAEEGYKGPVCGALDYELKWNGAATGTPVPATPVADTGGTWHAQVDVSYPFTTVVTWPGIPAQLTLHQQAVVPAIR